MKISEINNDLQKIIERFVNEIDHFNVEHDRLMNWIKKNDEEITKPLQLSSLIVDNEKFKAILHAAIHLQNDFENLQEHLQKVERTINDFREATGDSDGGKSTKIFEQLRQRFELLTSHYSDFLKRCKHVSEQSERHLMNYNEVNQLHDEIESSLKEFEETKVTKRVEEKPDSSLKKCSSFFLGQRKTSIVTFKHSAKIR